MKKQILLLLVFLLIGCGKPEVSPEPAGANAEKTDEANESVVETDGLTASLEGVVPDEYKEKEELFFQTVAASPPRPGRKGLRATGPVRPSPSGFPVRRSSITLNFMSETGAIKRSGSRIQGPENWKSR